MFQNLSYRPKLGSTPEDGLDSDVEATEAAAEMALESTATPDFPWSAVVASQDKTHKKMEQPLKTGKKKMTRMALTSDNFASLPGGIVGGHIDNDIDQDMGNAGNTNDADAAYSDDGSYPSDVADAGNDYGDKEARLYRSISYMFKSRGANSNGTTASARNMREQALRTSRDMRTMKSTSRLPNAPTPLAKPDVAAAADQNIQNIQNIASDRLPRAGATASASMSPTHKRIVGGRITKRTTSIPASAPPPFPWSFSSGLDAATHSSAGGPGSGLRQRRGRAAAPSHRHLDLPPGRVNAEVVSVGNVWAGVSSLPGFVFPRLGQFFADQEPWTNNDDGYHDEGHDGGDYDRRCIAQSLPKTARRMALDRLAHVLALPVVRNVCGDRLAHVRVPNFLVLLLTQLALVWRHTKLAGQASTSAQGPYFDGPFKARLSAALEKRFGVKTADSGSANTADGSEAPFGTLAVLVLQDVLTLLTAAREAFKDARMYDNNSSDPRTSSARGLRQQQKVATALDAWLKLRDESELQQPWESELDHHMAKLEEMHI